MYAWPRSSKTVREPRSWFYSALAQWCTSTGVGRASLRCRPGTTAADLIAAGMAAGVSMMWLLG